MPVLFKCFAYTVVSTSQQPQKWAPQSFPFTDEGDLLGSPQLLKGRLTARPADLKGHPLGPGGTELP